MTEDEIKAIIQDHAIWLKNEGGKRADLRGCILTGDVLSGSDLSWADLRGANLTWAYLAGTDISGADLRGAVLLGAVLFGAKGINQLQISEPMPYRWSAVNYGDHWMIAAGCRWFTLAEARARWLSPDYDGPQSVRDTVGPALDWLEKQPLSGKFVS
jgi:uncharacterized protein YjbI with pentapeptide repeats